jgi:hypothetical protein
MPFYINCSPKSVCPWPLECAAPTPSFLATRTCRPGLPRRTRCQHPDLHVDHHRHILARDWHAHAPRPAQGSPRSPLASVRNIVALFQTGTGPVLFCVLNARRPILCASSACARATSSCRYLPAALDDDDVHRTPAPTHNVGIADAAADGGNACTAHSAERVALGDARALISHPRRRSASTRPHPPWCCRRPRAAPSALSASLRRRYLRIALKLVLRKRATAPPHSASLPAPPTYARPHHVFLEL